MMIVFGFLLFECLCRLQSPCGRIVLPISSAIAWALSLDDGPNHPILGWPWSEEIC